MDVTTIIIYIFKKLSRLVTTTYYVADGVGKKKKIGQNEGRDRKC